MATQILTHKTSVFPLLTGFLLGGITYWFLPYGEIQILQSFLPYAWSFGTLLLAAFYVYVYKSNPSSIGAMLSLGVLLGILVRIIYDITFIDSTGHNLAPFELLLCAVFTVPSALLGAHITMLFVGNKRNS